MTILNETTLVFDFKLGRPGCVLLQAAMGGDSEIAKRIDSKYWLLNPTPDMKVYKLTGEQAEQLVAKFNGLPKRNKNEGIQKRRPHKANR